MGMDLDEYLELLHTREVDGFVYLDDEMDESAFELMKDIFALMTYRGEQPTIDSMVMLARNIINTFFSKNPLEVNADIRKKAFDLTSGYSRHIDKAQALFEWIIVNVTYGMQKRGPVGYRTSLETFWTSEGVCGEMAILFVAMASLVHIPSSYVSVDRDCHGRNVNHACAAVYDPILRSSMLIDPAYGKFNIDHQVYYHLEHRDLERLFRGFRSYILGGDNNKDMSRYKAVFPD